MTDETQAPEAEGMSLEDVYAKFDIQPKGETPPQQSTPTDATANAPTEQQQPHLQSEIDQLKQALQAQQARLDAAERQSAAEAETRDLDQAVEYAIKQIKPATPEQERLVKYALAEKYDSDKKFASAWDNRQKDPRAFSAVLEATIPDLRKAFSVKDVDQIAQNQLALDNAIKGSASEALEPDNQENKILQMNDAEFDHYWFGRMNKGY